MKYEEAKVLLCCGHYLAVTKACVDKKIICPRCGAVLKNEYKPVRITIVKSS